MKKAMSPAERQVKVREEAAKEGLKSLTVGFVKIEHIDAFKNAAKLSKEGALQLNNGNLFIEKPVDKIIKEKVFVDRLIVDLTPLQETKNSFLLGVYIGVSVSMLLFFVVILLIKWL